MEAITKTAVVKDGKVEIDVDSPDGTEFDVTLTRAKTDEDIQRTLARAARLHKQRGPEKARKR